MLRRIHPLTLCVEPAAGANRANDGVDGRLDAFGALHDVFEGVAHVRAAPVHQPGGVGMAIDAAVIAEIVFAGDVSRIAPVEDVVVNFGAMGMAADEAFAFVALAIGELATRNAGSESVERFFRGFLAARAHEFAAGCVAAWARSGLWWVGGIERCFRRGGGVFGGRCFSRCVLCSRIFWTELFCGRRDFVR